MNKNKLVLVLFGILAVLIGVAKHTSNKSKISGYDRISVNNIVEKSIPIITTSVPVTEKSIRPNLFRIAFNAY